MPAPDGPASTTHSPARTAKLTPATTGSRTPPCRCMVKVLATPDSSSATVMLCPHGGRIEETSKLRVGLARIVEHLVGQAGLDHLAALHHHDAMRQQPCDSEIVGDDHGREPELGDQPAQQVEQPRLHRHVEAAGRLVHEDQARLR